MSGNFPGVEIGAEQIYALGLSTKEAVDKLDGKLDRQGDRLDIHGEQLDDHEARLRAIESRRFASPAQIANLLIALVAAVIAALALFLH